MSILTAIASSVAGDLVKKTLGAIPAKVWLACILSGVSAYVGYLYRDRDAQIELTKAQAQVIIRTEKEIVEVEKVIEKHIVGDTKIEKIFMPIEHRVEYVETPDCTKLGAEWMGVYNTAAEVNF